MDRMKKMFLLLTIIGPLHMIEQLLTSIEEFYMIRGLLPGYYGLFDPAFADSATVILITLVWTLSSLMLYAFLAGGGARLAVLGIFGFFGVTEAHHVVEALTRGGYDPGVITSVPYAIVGGLLVAAVWREFRTATPLVKATESSFA